MRNTSWHKVLPGQIIYFTYKSKHDDVGYPRTVLVLNPKLRYKKKSTNRSKYYLVGLILDTRISRGLTAGQLKALFGKIGGIQVRDDGTFGPNLREGQTPESTSMVYNRLSEFVGNYDIWRTFSLAECRKRRVYLEGKWSKIPETDIKNAVESAIDVTEGTIERVMDKKLKESKEQSRKAAEIEEIDISKKFIKSVLKGLG